jgi:hypothetical protein
MKTWRSFEAAARSCGSRAWPSTICVPQICGLMVQNRTSDKVSCLRLTWRSCPGKLGREWYFEGRARAMRSRASARGGRASPNFSAMDESIRFSRGMRLATVMPPNETNIHHSMINVWWKASTAANGYAASALRELRIEVCAVSLRGRARIPVHENS